MFTLKIRETSASKKSHNEEVKYADLSESISIDKVHELTPKTVTRKNLNSAGLPFLLMSKLSILKGRGEIHIYKGATCLIQL
jgi:hypothetical protein